MTHRLRSRSLVAAIGLLIGLGLHYLYGAETPTPTKTHPVPARTSAITKTLTADQRAEYWKRAAAASSLESTIAKNEQIQTSNRADLKRLLEARDGYEAELRKTCVDKGEDLVRDDKTGDPACMTKPTTETVKK